MSKSSQIPIQPHKYIYQINQTIADRYIVIKPLGFGGFAEVYLCKDQRLDKSRAVKVITAPDMDIQEAKTAVQLEEHLNIVQIFDVETTKDKRTIIIFQYIDGVTLDEKLIKTKYRRLDLDKSTLKMIREIASAIDFAHDKNIIHRDIKPSNIIIDKSGRAYLTDFGLAEMKESIADESEPGTSMMSENIAHSLSGTVPYMAPEQLVDLQPANTRSDQYSLGVVTYEMLTGRFPYPGRDTKLIIQIGTTEPMPPTLANPELPQNINDVLLKVLNKDPEQRYKSCLEFVDSLDQAAKAYLQNNTDYKIAITYMESAEWIKALEAFKLLQNQAPPNFRDLNHQLEKAKQKVNGLNQLKKAESLINEGDYDEALKTLSILQEFDPEFQTNSLREEALSKKAEEQKQTREDLYQQAIEKFNNKNYQECLDTFNVLAKDPEFKDSQNIQHRAQEKVSQMNHWRELYSTGATAMHQEDWETALSSFEKLQNENSQYEDIENKLTTVRILARLSGLLKEANELFDEEYCPEAIDKIDELIELDKDYKETQVSELRKESITRLYRKSERLLQAKKLEDSKSAFLALQQREPDFPQLEDLQTRIEESIRLRDLEADLRSQYGEAKEKLELGNRDYLGALTIWNNIIAHKDDVVIPDRADVATRAKDGLYGDALAALVDNHHQEALEKWNQLHQIDPEYADYQNIEERAQAGIERRYLLKKIGIYAGITLGIIIAIVLFLMIRNNDSGNVDTAQTAEAATESAAILAATPTSTDTPTPTMEPTATELPTETNTPTIEPSKTATPTIKPTETDTLEPEPTATRALVGTVTGNTNLYPEPSSDEVITYVPTGSEVTILGRPAQGRWVLLQTDEATGYGSADYVQLPIGMELEDLPIIDGEIPLPEPTEEATEAADDWPTPTSFDALGTAVSLESATIYPAPDDSGDPATLPFVDEDDIVDVLGRNNTGSWLYIRDSNGNAGFVWGEFFDYPGRVSQLPIQNNTDSSTSTSSEEPSNPSPNITDLSMTVYAVDGFGTCENGGWTQKIFMEGHGGNGSYTYYWDGNKIAGPTNGNTSFDISSVGGAVIKKARVESGDGQVFEEDTFIAPPACNN